MPCNFTHIVHLGLSVNNHHKSSLFFVTQLRSYPLLLGIPWLHKHDATSKFLMNTVKFDSPHYPINCSSSLIPVSLNGLSAKKRETQLIDFTLFIRLAKGTDVQIFAYSHYEIIKTLDATRTKN